MSYQQSVEFQGAAALVTLRWPDFKAMVALKSVQIQHVTRADSYTIFAIDGDGAVAYSCLLVFTSFSPNFTFDSDYSQTQNDLDIADFEANFKPGSNRSIDPRTSDGRVRLASEKSLLTRTNFYTHNFCDPTTWYTASVCVPNETPTTMDYMTYTLAHQNVIDVAHGKILLEDYLVDPSGYKYTVTVTVNGTALHERVWPATTGGDFTVDYVNGRVTFAVMRSITDVVHVTYHYATTSLFKIAPTAGKKLTLDVAKVSFTPDDLQMNDTVRFDVWGTADYFLSPAQMTALGIPAGIGYKILLQPFLYKKMADFIYDAHDVGAESPSFGTGPRASARYCSFDWDYVAATALHSSMGMEIRAYLVNNIAFGGTAAVVTFYCLTENEP